MFWYTQFASLSRVAQVTAIVNSIERERERVHPECKFCILRNDAVVYNQSVNAALSGLVDSLFAAMTINAIQFNSTEATVTAAAAAAAATAAATATAAADDAPDQIHAQNI